MNIYHQDLIKLIQRQDGAWQTLQTQAPYRQAKQQQKLIQHQILNPLCGDEVIWHTYIENDIFSLLAHETIGCMLCQAASILTYQLLYQQNISTLEQQLQRNNFDKNCPNFHDDWEIFKPVLSAKNRLKCVSLPLLGLQELLAVNYKKGEARL